MIYIHIEYTIFCESQKKFEWIPRANETETKLETFHVMFKIYTSYITRISILYTIYTWYVI